MYGFLEGVNGVVRRQVDFRPETWSVRGHLPPLRRYGAKIQRMACGTVLNTVEEDELEDLNGETVDGRLRVHLGERLSLMSADLAELGRNLAQASIPPSRLYFHD